jgi:ATP-dependent DNA helicase RecG
LPESEARGLLEGLADSGLLERRGTRRSRTYHLSATIYRALDDPAGYVRVHGFERPQMEQMILQYVEAHGTITRREVIRMCRVSPSQASYLLRTLVERESLQLVGAGRSAHYVLGTDTQTHN